MIVAALSLFVITIVIGILNGLDVYDPGHDVLITHVHAGTLGWITLMVSAMALLAFSAGADVAKARTMGRLVTGAIALYVAAFWLGDAIFENRIQRPIAGTLLLIMVIWFLAWILRQRKAGAAMTVPQLGILLSWVSLLIGAVFGIILGLYIARGSVPGLSDDVASSLAEAHPPAMVIGFVILAGLAIAEWALRAERTLAEDRAGLIQMWLMFGAGVLINVAFIIGSEDLLGPANLIQIAAIVIFIKRLWPQLKPIVEGRRSRRLPAARGAVPRRQHGAAHLPGDADPVRRIRRRQSHRRQHGPGHRVRPRVVHRGDDQHPVRHGHHGHRRQPARDRRQARRLGRQHRARRLRLRADHRDRPAQAGLHAADGNGAARRHLVPHSKAHGAGDAAVGVGGGVGAFGGQAGRGVRTSTRR
jgi:hypothetical protein